MGNYGAPGHGDPDPWQGRRPDEPYGPSAEPPGWDGGEGWSGPRPPEHEPQPRRRGGRLVPVVAVLATLALLALAGGAVVLHRRGQGEPTPTGTPSEPAPAAATGAPDATASATASPVPEASTDPRFVKAGQCVRNDGPAGGKPKLLISACAPQTYEVLRRVDGPTSGEKDAATKCAKVDGYTNWYFFDSELDTLDFVLCLKQR
ncbi:LppU/SCO3897 family protein [Micromonospora sp. KLBMP9576]|uniref:LppU/SCO3897 family protein n=1 Tax=Micromonospora sp. KLBMP9576 TaxID=3424769 RepID=UPI003D8AF952